MSTNEQWKLREVSLIHQKILVIAEVAWPVPKATDSSSTDYLVTWEVDGGGLKGHLYTDSTSVTLSLWPNTVYHIQVELMSESNSIKMISSPLTIDTHKAPQVQQEERPLAAAPLIDRLPSSGASGRRLQATVAIGAAGAALSLFVIVILAVVGVRRQRRHATLAFPDHRSTSSVHSFTIKSFSDAKLHVLPCTIQDWQAYLPAHRFT